MNAIVQDWIAIGIGLLALVYLARRWWPSLYALFRPTASGQAGCGTTEGESANGASSACGSGCGQCGSARSPAVKDHRIQIVKRTH
ncbi:MAG: hypothetical protein KGI91_10070 [Burkholderiales bacterium]|nr:hypothetical protein [Burkholderiales bacterium]MDE2077403.1 hypothetical protein [Burkholderiales bacterium]